MKYTHFSWFPVSSKRNSPESKAEQSAVITIGLMTLLNVNSTYNKTTFQWVYQELGTPFLGKLLKVPGVSSTEFLSFSENN